MMNGILKVFWLYFSLDLAKQYEKLSSVELTGVVSLTLSSPVICVKA